MKNVRLCIACFILTFLFALNMMGQKIDFQTGNWESIKKEALKMDKPIFVDAFTTWCGPCKWMDKNVFTDEEVIEYYNANFINYKLDMEKGEGPKFATTYQVNAFPTLLFISGSGELIHKAVGSRPPAEFIKEGEIAYDPTQNIGSLMTEFNAGNRSPEFLKNYLKAMQKANMDITDVADEYFSIVPETELTSEANFLMLVEAADGMNHPFFKLINNKKGAFSKSVGQNKVNDALTGIAKNSVYKALLMGDQKQIASTLKEMSALNEPMRGEVTNFANLIKSQKSGDHIAYVSAMTENYKKYSKNDWQVLNSMAWDIFEDTEHSDTAYLKLGIKMAKRSVKLSSNFYNNDTYAALLYKSGKYKKAEKYALNAISYAKASGEEYGETQALLDKIKEKM